MVDCIQQHMNSRILGMGLRVHICSDIILELGEDDWPQVVVGLP